jgi:NTP pyrophosphatase (non-canonical NTP hydrolase)
MQELISRIQKLTTLEKKSLVLKALKLSEETGEVAEAVLSFEEASGSEYKQKTASDIVEECVDVIIVATSIINSLTMDDAGVKNLFDIKLDKWENKMSK